MSIWKVITQALENVTRDPDPWTPPDFSKPGGMLNEDGKRHWVSPTPGGVGLKDDSKDPWE